MSDTEFNKYREVINDIVSPSNQLNESLSDVADKYIDDIEEQLSLVDDIVYDKNEDAFQRVMHKTGVDSAWIHDLKTDLRSVNTILEKIRFEIEHED